MPKYDPKKHKSFEIFYNALSVGWHLQKIADADPNFMAGDELWERFTGWMNRHALKKDVCD